MGMNDQSSIRLGAGAGFSGDRIDPATELAAHGELDYLIFECLGERTVAQGHLRRRHHPDAGYDPLLVSRVTAVIESAIAQGTTVITNGGSANPSAGAAAVQTALAAMPLPRPVTIAAVHGDDVLDMVRSHNPIVWETNHPVSTSEEELVSANAYLGAEAILPALEKQADVIITGRVADPSLYLAPMVYEFGWSLQDFHHLGRGTAIGHLLECAGQLTGGYFADPVTKPVPGLARLGFPFADVQADGAAEFSKLERAGGLVDTRTCREQLLYEVHDPHAYLTPDVTADFSAMTFQQVEAHRVAAEGATGRQRPEELKVSLGFRGGFSGEGQITYAGPRAEERAQVAGDVVVERLQQVHQVSAENLTVELIGTGSSFRRAPGSGTHTPAPEVRLRVSGHFPFREQAQAVGWEVEALYTNGPAGGGGARTSTSEVVAIRSASLPRDAVSHDVQILEASP